MVTPTHIPGLTRPELDRALVYHGGLAAFVRLAWPIVEGETPLVWNWHLEFVCAHLEAILRGAPVELYPNPPPAIARHPHGIPELCINVPPGTSKTTCASVMFPAFTWGPGGQPWHRFMCTSFDGRLSLRDAAKCKDLVRSDWYQERWGYDAPATALARWGLRPVNILGEQTHYKNAKDNRAGNKSSRSDSASEYYTTGGGMRFSTFIGGKAMGWHAHTQICDDPVKPKDIQKGGPAAREKLAEASTVWSGTYSSRKADPNYFNRLVIMQRLAEDDLAGECIRQGYLHVMLPKEFDPARRCVTSFGTDPRTEAGEPLDKVRFPPHVIERDKRMKTAREWAAQEQQDPTPDGGSLFERAWFSRVWRELPRGIHLVQSWDCTFKDTTTADWVVGQVWGRHGADFYLVDQVRRKMSIVDTCKAILRLRERWPQARTILVEDKANGSAVMQILRSKVPGLTPVSPQDGKIARANAVSIIYEHNVYMPDKPWAPEFIEEHVKFPMGKHDDQVDTGTQAVTYLDGGGGRGARLAQAMDNIDL